MEKIVTRNLVIRSLSRTILIFVTAWVCNTTIVFAGISFSFGAAPSFVEIPVHTLSMFSR